MGEWGWVIRSLANRNRYKIDDGSDLFFRRKFSTRVKDSDNRKICNFLMSIYSAAALSKSILAIVGSATRSLTFRDNDLDIWINSINEDRRYKFIKMITQLSSKSGLYLRKSSDRIGMYRSDKKLIDVYVSNFEPKNFIKHVDSIRDTHCSAILPLSMPCIDHPTPYLHINPPKLTHYLNIV